MLSSERAEYSFTAGPICDRAHGGSGNYHDDNDASDDDYYDRASRVDSDYGDYNPWWRD